MKKNKVLSHIITTIVIVLLQLVFISCDGEIQNNETPETTAEVDYSEIHPIDYCMNDYPGQGNFLSRSTSVFPNINGKNVSVDLFVRYSNEVPNNPNSGQAILINQCIKYKEQNPSEDVYITCTSFHFSIIAAVCLDESSPEYGKMKSLPNSDEDEDGYIRISALLVEAAKIGIYVTAIGQIDATEIGQGEISFDTYFNSRLDEVCYNLPWITPGEKVCDYLDFKKVFWTSYGDRSAADMMHVKSCTVSAYLDSNGIEHGGSVWFGSINLDGLGEDGSNAGHDSLQTGVIISDHEELYNVALNVTKLISKYSNQEDILLFRNHIRENSKKQIDLINNGRGNEIPDSEKVVYIGSDSDNIFRLYFTPLGGVLDTWDTDYNPLCKYIALLRDSEDYRVFSWNNPKYLNNFQLSYDLREYLLDSFVSNPNANNRLYLHLPGFDGNQFSDLTKGKEIGFCSINDNLGYNIHSKDIQLSYVKDGIRHYTSIISSCNFHQGALYYQANTLLVIDETETNEIFRTLGIMTSCGAIY